MKAAEIRAKFLKYFEKNGHSIVESSPLVPQNDPTLLFTNAGMVQFKDVFLGTETRAYKRATTTQKCVRAGGKHNDLENVGFTARHHTFFEMLGNFSFGDYFKKDAIRFAWEFVTKELQIPKDRLYVTVFETDDEAADLWHKQEGIPRERISRFGEKDNFWAMGDTGPCGPCTEIFIDRGQKYGCGKSSCAVGCDCDRFMEIWNLVFMQFDRDASGKLTPLPKPSVDTGAGLERIASVMQNVDTNFDIDIFRDIIRRVSELAGRQYSPGDASAGSFRVIADHARATAFLIGDGVLPSNEGRGYVLRRIMRRAIRHGKKLGFTEPFLYKVCESVIDQMKDAFRDLTGKRELILKAARAEEEQFFRTLERGLSLLDEETAKLGVAKTLPGEVAFKLYDTYGFPLDLTRVICAEKGINVDEAGFEKAMEWQRETSRKHWKGSGEEAVEGVYMEVAEELRKSGGMPKFVGYDGIEGSSKCVALVVPGGSKGSGFSRPASITGVELAQKGADTVMAVFAETPFYGESGGQVGDKGVVTGPGGFRARVVDVKKPVSDLIVAHLKDVHGMLKVGEVYRQQTDAKLRALTARNHTATHLLHWALREVLGAHVKQSGSLVEPDYLRFDFTHFQAMTPDEIRKVEDLVNEKVWSGDAVSKQEMDKDKALESGAIAFFGEKYGDRVRVVKVGDYSTEFCGGTHVDRASDIHLFRIANESGIAAGVRRIVAYTSEGAFQFLREQDERIRRIQARLKASSREEAEEKLDKLAATERDLRKKIETLEGKMAGNEVDELIGRAEKVDGACVVAAQCRSNASGVKALREISDRIKQKLPDAVVILGMADPEGDKAYVLASVGPKAPKSLSAGELIKEIAPLIDGRGGGKPDMAQAGGTKPAGLEAAIEAGRKRVRDTLKGQE